MIRRSRRRSSWDRQHSYVVIDNEKVSAVILPISLIEEGQLLGSGERMCISTG